MSIEQPGKAKLRLVKLGKISGTKGEFHFLIKVFHPLIIRDSMVC